MKKPKNDSERLQAVIDAVEESILNASDEELAEDIRLEGREPETTAANVQRLIATQIKAQRQKKLQAAKAGYAEHRKQRRSDRLSRLTNSADRRALLQQVLSRPEGVPDGLTMAFREGRKMSDNDVVGLLEDLDELGLLPDGDEQ